MMCHSSHQATPKGGRLQNLPPELSIQILKECIPQRMDRKGRQFFLALRTLFSDWREVCYTTPEWWSTLSINFVEEMNVGDEERLKSLLQVARGWFGRSGIGATLELSVVEGTAFPETGVPILVQFLHDQINRWKALDLDIGRDTFALALMMLRLPIPMEWPALASLKVKWRREWQAGMGSPYADVTFLNSMPSLRRFQLIHFNGSDIPVSPRITSLETVGINPFSGFPDDLYLPSLFPSLTTLNLEYDAP
ncbi:hypothetical protein BKA70DRAFT_692691 [Coprinopsis sp. MPI-PUGE-AT-0042]|nr:hypothetical protein BKA70DRAFT_692691 [Coprinopsis sp. MPI-PUGE-AT-0042]